ncbi:fact complex subunit spt16 [Anaeramoeba flamelloides]|uniref:FACT complex subunit n=1 Tax=Anaeramoeba flamelloides TaxID=1746091 RepID=A0AAV7ZBV3_9EUKA|nr:fact complex subunit spt16 [Anaeramoeba flamelloides]
MSESAQISTKEFIQRTNRIYSLWENDIDCYCIVVGRVKSGTSYVKSNSLQFWLFGWELPDTLIILCKNKTIHFFSSQKKIDLFKQINTEEYSLIYHTYQRGKKPETKDQNSETLNKIFDQVKSSNEKEKINFGMFPNEKWEGTFFTHFNEILETKKEQTLQIKDISFTIAKVFSIKDTKEISNFEVSGKLTTAVLSKFVIPNLIRIIDKNRKYSHINYSEKIKQIMVKAKQFKVSCDEELVGSVFTPVIQSGGQYDLEIPSTSSKGNIQPDTILCSLGISYDSYPSYSTRTIFIDPNSKQEENYSFVETLYTKLEKEIIVGKTFLQIYKNILNEVTQKRPELELHLIPNFGFVTGIEFFSKELTISPNVDPEVKVENGMVLVLRLGLHNLNVSKDENENKSENGKKYSILISDTYIVQENKPLQNLTVNSNKTLSEISYQITDKNKKKSNQNQNGEINNQQNNSNKEKEKGKGRGSNNNNTDNNYNRDEDMDVDSSLILEKRLRTKEYTEQLKKREDHQRFLEEKKLQEIENRFLKKKSNKNISEEIRKQKIGILRSYKSAMEIPKHLRRNRIYVDKKHETVLLPLYGKHVPFHISYIKNITKNDEGDVVYLRINFNNPSNIGKKSIAVKENMNSIFVKDLTFRSSDAQHFHEVWRVIKEIKKKITNRETDKLMKMTIVKQEDLILSRGNVPRLAGDLFLKPTILGRKTSGSLEAHRNGFRFTSRRGQIIDILYKNIKHAFFQPCGDSDTITLIHFHLQFEIIVGKKKTRDVQFYTEVVEKSREISRYHVRDRYGGQNEDRAERALKKRINQVFQNFVSKIEEKVESLEFDIPYNDLEFTGVVSRYQVTFRPTLSCLVQLSSWPTTVITIDEVEIAYFQRMSFGLKNFDLIFVFKDYTTTPLHINLIPKTFHENIQMWLDKSEIPYYSGKAALNWTMVMKIIRDDPKQFVKDGGWSVLSNRFGDPDSDNDEEEESEFSPPGSDEDSEEFNEPSDSDDDEDNFSDEISEETLDSLTSQDDED